VSTICRVMSSIYEYYGPVRRKQGVALHVGRKLVAVNRANGATYRTRNEHRSNECTICSNMGKLPSQAREEMLGRFSGRFVHNRDPIPIFDGGERPLRPLCAWFKHDDAAGCGARHRISFIQIHDFHTIYSSKARLPLSTHGLGTWLDPERHIFVTIL